MGEMADMLIEQGLDMMLDGDDAWDYPPVKDKTCKYCGESGFHWTDTRNGWRLADHKGHLHNCWDKTKERTRVKTNDLNAKRNQAIATRCPVCGDEYGMSPGTGDCNCGDEW